MGPHRPSVHGSIGPGKAGFPARGTSASRLKRDSETLCAEVKEAARIEPSEQRRIDRFQYGLSLVG
jgi:hypothetical protein